MMQQDRRQFLADVGRGMLVASVGSTLAADLGLARVNAAEAPELTFGKLESLVCLMQETPADKLLPALVAKHREGTPLDQLVAAGAFANVRAFGGEDYIGFHTMMALSPAYAIARELSGKDAALPVLKVLYRNTKRIQEKGGRTNEVLKPIAGAPVPDGKAPGEAILDAFRKKDMKAADSMFAALVEKSADEAFNHLMYAVADGQEVHRIVMPYRAWDLLSIVGKEHAATMLRQSVHYCVKQESPRYSGYFAKSRALLPKLFDQHKLDGKTPGTKTADDAWVDNLATTIFKGPPEQAAGAVAAALAEGYSPAVIGEALALATNHLVLRDNGRPQGEVSTGKPAGSTHGDSVGVHACDSANAWRNIARASNSRNTFACLILGAHQASQDRLDRGGDGFLNWEPYPRADARERVKAGSFDELLAQLDAAIKAKDQPLASAVVNACGQAGHPHDPIFAVLRRYAISEDGALHAEKFYHTVRDEFASTRAAFRWRHLIGLARVTASASGQPAPGIAEARKLLQG